MPIEKGRKQVPTRAELEAQIADLERRTKDGSITRKDHLEDAIEELSRLKKQLKDSEPKEAKK